MSSPDPTQAQPADPTAEPAEAQGRQGSKQPGALLIVSGPSGVGKTTIVRRIMGPLGAELSVSLTTRPMRPKDRPGVDYEFVDEAEFIRRRQAGDLLEWAEVHGNLYGTPRGPVEQALRSGHRLILEIDVEGARQVKQKLPQTLAIFIEPPSEADLERRLRTRKSDDEATIQRRLAKARHEIRQAHESGVYEAFIVNRDLDAAVRQTLWKIRDRLGDPQPEAPPIHDATDQP